MFVSIDGKDLQMGEQIYETNETEFSKILLQEIMKAKTDRVKEK